MGSKAREKRGNREKEIKVLSCNKQMEKDFLL